MGIATLLAQAAACVVVHVADGDTLSVRCDVAGGPRTFVVRLADIDAPEDGQAFGARSRRALVERCLRQPAAVEIRSSDTYGRAVARVGCNGTDASAGQVSDGLAWVFDRYVRDRSLYRLQDAARSSRAGLWADPEPVPPWEWRRERAATSGTRR